MNPWTKLTDIAVWVLEKVLFKFLGGHPHRGIGGEIFSSLSVCEICPANRWYQLQDQSGMNYETIRSCRVGECWLLLGSIKIEISFRGQPQGTL